MTKRDFEAVAEGVRDARHELQECDQKNDGPILSDSEWDYIFIRVVDNLARQLKMSNPRFDHERFRAACKKK